jgi:hypothetical protein
VEYLSKGDVKMAKYYVESGTMRAVVAAEDEQRAALWAVHRAMQQIVPLYDDPTLSPAQKSAVAATEGLLVLDDSIHLNEVGFGRDDGIKLDTADVVAQWHQLMTALTRLEAVLPPES